MPREKIRENMGRNVLTKEADEEAVATVMINKGTDTDKKSMPDREQVP